LLTKMAIHYATRRDDKTRSRYVRKPITKGVS
jgi:hypothetical protein